MTVNYLIGGSTSLQNELLKLLGEKEETQPSDKEETQPSDKEETQQSDKEETVKLNDVIKDAEVKQNIEDAKFVNSDMSGGTNIVGLGENILAGGGLNNKDEKQVSSKDEKQVNNNSVVSGEEIIGNILIEGGDRVDNENSGEIKNIDKETGVVEEDKYISDDDISDGGKDISSNSDDDYSTSENSDESDSDDEFGNQYIKIINEMRNYSSNPDHQNLSLSGGSVKSVNRVKVLNMFPWILKSSDQ